MRVSTTMSPTGMAVTEGNSPAKRDTRERMNMEVFIVAVRTELILLSSMVVIVLGGRLTGGGQEMFRRYGIE